MKIGLVASVKPSHPYLENDPAPLFDLHYLRISPWLWFRSLAGKPLAGFRATPDRRITSSNDIIVYVIRFTNLLLHR